MAEVVTGPDETTLTWSGRAIDGGRVEAELARLRYRAAGEPGGGEGFAIRTSMLNLIVYSEDEESARRASQMIVALPGHHPSRAVVLIARPSAGASRVDARLAAHCHVTPGLEQQVCCEEVTLTVSGPAAEHLHSVVIPLLVPDLPVFVWWDAPLPENPHSFEEMVEAADRIIVDSAHLADAGAALVALERLCGQSAPGCSIGDLNWQRLETWRDVITRHCESPPLNLFLPGITRVTVGFAGERGDPVSTPAFLFLGWLANRHGWDTKDALPQGPGTASIPFDGRNVTVAAEPVAYAGVEAGWLVSVEVTCSRGGEEASLSVLRTGDPLHLLVNVREPHGAIEESVRIEGCAEGEMLARELDAPSGDAEYSDVLAEALHLIGAMRNERPRRRAQRG